jgi:hypothetical protein
MRRATLGTCRQSAKMIEITDSLPGHAIMRPALRMELTCPIIVKNASDNRVTNAATLCKSVWRRLAA